MYYTRQHLTASPFTSQSTLSTEHWTRHLASASFSHITEHGLHIYYTLQHHLHFETAKTKSSIRKILFTLSVDIVWCVTQWLTGRHRHRHDTVTGRHCFETARAVLGAATGRGPRRRDCGILRGGIVTLALSRGCPLSIAVLCSGLSHHGSENIIRYIP